MLRKINHGNIYLMSDLFHMDIEDASIEENLKIAKDRIAYVHFGDSNRRAPAHGHLDFPEIIHTLKDISYTGFISLEILPYPDPGTATSKEIKYLRRFI